MHDRVRRVWYLLCNFYMNNLLSGAHCERRSCETDSSALLRGNITQLTSNTAAAENLLKEALQRQPRRIFFFLPPRTEENQAENECKKIRKEYKSTLVSTEHLSLAPGALQWQGQWTWRRIPPAEGKKINHTIKISLSKRHLESQHCYNMAKYIFGRIVTLRCCFYNSKHSDFQK